MSDAVIASRAPGRREIVLSGTAAFAVATGGVAAGVPPAKGAIFDSHMHLATGDRLHYPPAPIDGVFNPRMLVHPNTAEAFAALMQADGVVRACAVQRAHLYGYDNRYIIDAARRYPTRFAAVVVLDTVRADAPALLADLVRRRVIAAIRMMGSGDVARTDAAWLTSDRAMAVWEVAARTRTPVDIEMLQHETAIGLPALASIAARFPHLPIVLDHVGLVPALDSLSKAEIATLYGSPAFGLAGIARHLANARNVSFKITAMNFEHLDHDAVAARAFVVRAIATVGAARLMWGSDFPQTPGEYPAMVAEARAATADLDARTRRLILHDNAGRFFGRLPSDETEPARRV